MTSSFRRLANYLQKQPPPFHVILGIALTLLVGVADYATGPLVTLTVFYLMPLALTTWYAGRNAGLLVLPITIVTFAAANGLPPGNHNLDLPHLVWNYLARSSVAFFTVLVFAALKSSHENERRLARTDPLTGAANLRALRELANIEIELAHRSGHPFVVAFLDVDKFKQVNDRFGHHAGDQALIVIFQTLRAGLRPFDLLARTGGDEFVLLLPEVNADSTEAILRRLQKALLALAGEHGWPLGFSFGAVLCQHPTPPLEELIRLADRQMYTGKDWTGNQVHVKPLDDLWQPPPGSGLEPGGLSDLASRTRSS